MKQYGFTLIEMVLTIMLLGIVGISLSSLVLQGTEVYVSTTARDALTQQGRFITDRMHKELRNAIPGSVRVSNSNHCIEWLPIKNSAIYENIPVTPASANSIRILPESSIDAADKLVVYPVNRAELYSAVTATSSVAQAKTAVTFTPATTANMVDVSLTQTPHSFPAGSPAKRLYIYDQPRAYCWRNNAIYLYQGYGLHTSSIDPNTLSGNSVLMAENITRARFAEAAPELRRNAMVMIELEFTDRGETLRFDHNVLIHNTP